MHPGEKIKGISILESCVPQGVQLSFFYDLPDQLL